MKVEFETSKFLSDVFGGPDGVIGLANKNNIDVPDRETVRKWFQRGAVPGPWWPIVFSLWVGDERGQPDMRPYFKEVHDGIFG